MHVKERFTQLKTVVVQVGGFIARHQRGSIAVAVGLGVAVLLLRRSMPGRPEGRSHRR